jgi:hypothetical protein
LNTEYYNPVNCCPYIISLEWDCIGGKPAFDTPMKYTIEPNMRGRYDLNCTPGSRLSGKATRVDKMDNKTQYGYPTNYCDHGYVPQKYEIIKRFDVNR